MFTKRRSPTDRVVPDKLCRGFRIDGVRTLWFLDWVSRCGRAADRLHRRCPEQFGLLLLTREPAGAVQADGGPDRVGHHDQGARPPVLETVETGPVDQGAGQSPPSVVRVGLDGLVAGHGPSVADQTEVGTEPPVDEGTEEGGVTLVDQVPGFGDAGFEEGPV